MNEIQRKTLMGIGAVIFGMLIFPPYRIYGRGDYSSTLFETGYGFLFDLPSSATVDVSTLLTQWVGVIIVGAIAIFLLKDR